MTSKDIKLTYDVKKSVEDVKLEKTLINQVSNSDKEVKHTEKNLASTDRNEFLTAGIE
jgi:hypothetical protein